MISSISAEFSEGSSRILSVANWRGKDRITVQRLDKPNSLKTRDKTFSTGSLICESLLKNIFEIIRRRADASTRRNLIQSLPISITAVGRLSPGTSFLRSNDIGIEVTVSVTLHAKTISFDRG